MLWSGGTNTWSRVRRTPGSVHQVLSPQTPLKKISHLLVSNILQLITNIQFCQKYPVKTSGSFRCNTGTQSQTVVSGFTLSWDELKTSSGRKHESWNSLKETRLKKEATEQLRAFWITTDCCFSMCSSDCRDWKHTWTWWHQRSRWIRAWQQIRNCSLLYKQQCSDWHEASGKI